MAEWKKIVVSGSAISQLNNDSNYLVVTDTIDSASVAARATTLSPAATASIADRATSASIADSLSQLATASHALTAVTASHALNVPDTASFALSAQSASVAERATTLSADATASFADLASDARTADSASVAARATTLSADATASHALTAVTASFAENVAPTHTASFALNAESASVAVRATTLSADATASFADLASSARNADSASVAARATTLSADATASIADRATTASFADLAGDSRNADSASVAARATTLSSDATASFADRATSASIADDIKDLAVTNAKIAVGTIANDRLVNDSVTLGTTEIDLGTTATSIAGLDNISATTGSFVLQIFESSSTIITSGSNIFGDAQNDIQQFTGSILQTGSMTTTGTITAEEVSSDKFSGSFSGSFQGDGSGLTGLAGTLTVDGDSGTEDVDLIQDDLQVLGTANEIETAVTKVGNDVRVTLSLPDTIEATASVATRANALAPTATASFADRATSASIADELSQLATASFADRATTASFAETVAPTHTASFALNAESASVAARATTLSADATASFADSATTASIANELSGLATASIADTATTASHAITAVSASATVAGLLFPVADGLVNQALVTDGAGQMSYGDIFGTGSTKKLNQTVGATTWSFAHNLNELYPIIQVYDGDDNQLIPERVEAVDVDNSRIYFATNTTGVAAAMVGGMGISASNATRATSASIADELSGLATASIADTATSASHAETATLARAGSGSFSGSFEGDGSNLTGLATTLTIDADSGGTSTVDLQTQTLDVAGTAGEIETSVSGQTITVGLPNNVTIANDLTVTNNATIAGDLVVDGSIVSASSLAVEDQFIILASGSNGAIDGGIIVNQVDDHPDGKGVAFAYDSSANRWALETGLNDSASVITPDAFMGVIQESAGAPASNPTYGGTSGKGTIFVDTSNDEAYIYV